jgi:hypothetical protein
VEGSVGRGLTHALARIRPERSIASRRSLYLNLGGSAEIPRNGEY